MEKIDRIGLQ